MIVHDFNVESVPVNPTETYSPLVVDANTVLTDAIPTQRFKMIARRNSQITESSCVVQVHQLSSSTSLDCSESRHIEVVEQSFDIDIAERADHLASL